MEQIWDPTIEERFVVVDDIILVLAVCFFYFQENNLQNSYRKRIEVNGHPQMLDLLDTGPPFLEREQINVMRGLWIPQYEIFVLIFSIDSMSTFGLFLFSFPLFLCFFLPPPDSPLAPMSSLFHPFPLFSLAQPLFLFFSLFLFSSQMKFPESLKK